MSLAHLIGNSPGDELGAGFRVKLPAFTGPLHLLLALLEQHDLDIAEVSLVAVTSAYLEAIENLDALPAASVCAFLDVASRLMVLKARALVPDLAPDEDAEDDADIADLLDQLTELSRFSGPVSTLKQRRDAGLHSYQRIAPLPQQRMVNVPALEQSSRLRSALVKLARSLPRIQTVAAPTRPDFTIAGQAQALLAYLRRWQEAGSQRYRSFFAMFEANAPRAEILATFLAMLEMIKSRTVSAHQEQPFGDIGIQLTAPAATRLPADGGTEAA